LERTELDEEQAGSTVGLQRIQFLQSAFKNLNSSIKGDAKECGGY